VTYDAWISFEGLQALGFRDVLKPRWPKRNLSRRIKRRAASNQNVRNGRVANAVVVAIDHFDELLKIGFVLFKIA